MCVPELLHLMEVLTVPLDIPVVHTVMNTVIVFKESSSCGFMHYSEDIQALTVLALSRSEAARSGSAASIDDLRSPG
jgi:hypothetical protein